MSNLTEQQHKAVVSVGENVLVSAGAGSGKTHVLVERYVELLRNNPEVTVDMIIAVTFTRKAAGEMRNRLKLKFKELSESETKSSERWLKCLQDIDLAKIGTIHSLCESILKAFPAEAKIDPQFEVVDDVTQTELIEECVLDALRQALAEEASETELIIDMNFDEVRSWLVSALKSSIQFRASFEKMIHLNEAELVEYMNKIRHEIQIDLLRDTLHESSWSDAISFLDGEEADGKLEDQRLLILECERDIRESVSNLENLKPEDSANLWKKLASLSASINLRVGPKTDEAKAIKSAMKKIRSSANDLTEDLPPEINEEHAEQFKYCRWLVQLFRRAVSIYSKKKQIELLLDYDDMISLTAKVLKQPGSIARKYFQDRLYAILVDEFQDTNSLQAEVVSLLAGEKTRLFLIGDDKQSIYKFQGADVSTFNNWRHHMNSFKNSIKDDISLSGDRLSLKLTMSFRSHPEVVKFVNYVFDRVFTSTGKEISYRALFEPLKAARQLPDTGCDDENVDFVFYSSSDDFAKFDRFEKQKVESLAVADWINSKIESKSPVLNADGSFARTLCHGDFAILVSKNSDFEAVEYGLSKRNIPYSIFAGRGFLNRQEIVDIENLLRFLGNRRDSHSLMGVLRSPMFAISDDLIHEVVRGPGNGKTLWRKLQSYRLNGKPGYENLRKAIILLRHLIRDAASLNLSELVRSIVVRTNYELALLNDPKGTQRARNLFKLISMAKDYEHMSCGEFATQLKQMREFNIKQSDAPIGTSDSVKVMTIHASKGLEYPCVALPALSSQLTRYQGRLIYHPTYGIAVNSVRDDKEPKPPWYGYASKLDSEMELAERRRLLYVAMTRARDYLGIFVEQESSNKATFRNWISDALNLNLDEFGFDDTGSAAVPPAESSPPCKFTLAKRVSLGTENSGVRFSISKYNYQEEEVGSTSEEIDETEAFSRLDLSLVDKLPSGNVDVADHWPVSSRITPTSNQEPFLAANLVGNYFHKMMESLVNLSQYPDSAFFENVAYELGVIVSHPVKRELLIAEGEKFLKLFWDSDLHTMMIMSRQRFREFPYLMVNEENITSRRPDLILQDEHGKWFIIDFKTDDFPIKDLENHVNRHRRQVLAYAKDLEKLTGVKYTPAIYFARHGKLFIIGQGLDVLEPTPQPVAVEKPVKQVEAVPNPSKTTVKSGSVEITQLSLFGDL